MLNSYSCKHMLAMQWKSKGSRKVCYPPEMFFASLTWRLQYLPFSENIRRNAIFAKKNIEDLQHSPFVNKLLQEAPFVKRPKGRPRNKRINPLDKATKELRKKRSDEGSQQMCSRCKESGHKVGSCIIDRKQRDEDLILSDSRVNHCSVVV